MDGLNIGTSRAADACAAAGRSHEELYNLARAGNEHALATLIADYKPLFLAASRMYWNRMETYGVEDYLQEGAILIWKIVDKGNYSTAHGSFGGYLKSAYTLHLAGLWQKYTMKNLIPTAEVIHTAGDGTNFTRTFGTGFADRYYGVSDKAEKYREQRKERARRWNLRKAAEIDAERASKGLPPIYRPSLATEAEKAEHARLMVERRRERSRLKQREIRQRDTASYNEYRRIQGGISRSRKAVENWMQRGNKERAEKAREKLADYEAQMAAFKAAR